MARIYVCGFELQTTTQGMEWSSTTNGSPAIETTIKHAGAAALRINNTGAAENIIHIFRSTQGPVWLRVYFYIVSAPASTRQFVSVLNTANVKIGVRLSSGTPHLELFNEEDVVQVGSNSSNLSLDTWHRLEIKIDDTTLASTAIEARLYAASDEATLIWNPSGTIDITASPNRFRLGTNGADANLDVVYDDWAVNDSSGSFCNSWCGEGELEILRPDANSGSPQWSRGGTDSGANWSQVEELPPNDATDYVESNTNDQVDEYTLGATSAAIASDDTITFVGPSARFAISATTGADPEFVVGVKDGSNFDETSGLSGAGSTTWATGQTTLPCNSPALGNNSNYEVPGTSNAYTKSVLDSLVFRLRETLTDTHFMRVSAAWVYVDHKPAAAVSEPFPAGHQKNAFNTLLRM